MTGPADVEWRVAGSYFEACNCTAVCPCRRVGERDGGRSSYGVCQFALSWQIDRGHAGTVTIRHIAGPSTSELAHMRWRVRDSDGEPPGAGDGADLVRHSGTRPSGSRTGVGTA